jgi:pSer/pThr/pTyr-binding forkhead associated (FHA) protein
MNARLLVLSGFEVGTFMPINGETLIGRLDTCQIRPAHPTVSRKHCRIFSEEDKFFVEDLGSMNGTTVNGSKIQSKIELKDGDSINVATVEFRFVLSDGEINGTVIADQKTTLRNESFLSRFE